MGGLGFSSVIRSGNEHIKDSDIVVLRTNGSDMYVGMPVGQVGESTIDCDPSVIGDRAFTGIIISLVHPSDDYDVDTVIADNTLVNVLKPTGGRVTMAGLYLSGVADAVPVGKSIILSSTAGKLQWNDRTSAFDGSDPQTDAETKVESDLITDFLDAGVQVGRAAKALTGHATEDRIVLYNY